MQISRLHPAVQSSIHVVSMHMNKPAYLPFYLIAWAQKYVQRRNCSPPDLNPSAKEQGHIGRDETLVSRPSNHHNLHSICAMNLNKQHHGPPLHVTYYDTALIAGYHIPLIESEEYDPNAVPVSNYTVHLPLHPGPLQYVYYSECDQIVRWDSLETLQAISNALNESLFFTGRRKEKVPQSPPEMYMGGLNNWRDCGQPGYSMTWPRDIHVRVDL